MKTFKVITKLILFIGTASFLMGNTTFARHHPDSGTNKMEIKINPKHTDWLGREHRETGVEIKNTKES